MANRLVLPFNNVTTILYNFVDSSGVRPRTLIVEIKVPMSSQLLESLNELEMLDTTAAEYIDDALFEDTILVNAGTPLSLRVEVREDAISNAPVPPDTTEFLEPSENAIVGYIPIVLMQHFTFNDFFQVAGVKQIDDCPFPSFWGFKLVAEMLRRHPSLAPEPVLLASLWLPAWYLHTRITLFIYRVITTFFGK